MRLLPAIGLLYRADLIFADPPYFLSNGGTTCRGGKRVSVDKGDWDRFGSVDEMHEFNLGWLRAALDVLAPHGTIWVSGTSHNIHSVGFTMQRLGFRLLNDIVWEKPNPPPNLSCKTFRHSTETILWAARGGRARYRFNYQEMRDEAGGRQMKTVWQFPPASRREKSFGDHPTQKPIALLERIIRAGTNEGDLVIDPFVGSGTTGIAACGLGRFFIGIDLESGYLDIAIKRYKALTA